MDDHTTTKLDAFRSLVHKSGALQTELTTLDSAIRERDAIKIRIGTCVDESEARKLLGDLTRAEESVTLKSIREPRLRDELAAIVKEAEFAHFEVMSAIDAMLNGLADVTIQPFRELLLFLQPEEENTKRDDANNVVLKAFVPAVLVEDMFKMLHNASHSVGVATSDPYGPAKGLRAALEITDAILARLPEAHKQRKRHAAACEAFRKVLANG